MFVNVFMCMGMWITIWYHFYFYLENVFWVCSCLFVLVFSISQLYQQEILSISLVRNLLIMLSVMTILQDESYFVVCFVLFFILISVLWIWHLVTFQCSLLLVRSQLVNYWDSPSEFLFVFGFQHFKYNHHVWVSLLLFYSELVVILGGADYFFKSNWERVLTSYYCTIFSSYPSVTYMYIFMSLMFIFLSLFSRLYNLYWLIFKFTDFFLLTNPINYRVLSMNFFYYTA